MMPLGTPSVRVSCLLPLKSTIQIAHGTKMVSLHFDRIYRTTFRLARLGSVSNHPTLLERC